MSKIKTFESYVNENSSEPSFPAENIHEMTNIIYNTLMGIPNPQFETHFADSDPEIDHNVIQFVYMNKKYTITVDRV